MSGVLSGLGERFDRGWRVCAVDSILPSRFDGRSGVLSARPMRFPRPSAIERVPLRAVMPVAYRALVRVRAVLPLIHPGMTGAEAQLIHGAMSAVRCAAWGDAITQPDRYEAAHEAAKLVYLLQTQVRLWSRSAPLSLFAVALQSASSVHYEWVATGNWSFDCPRKLFRAMFDSVGAVAQWRPTYEVPFRRAAVLDFRYAKAGAPPGPDDPLWIIDLPKGLRETFGPAGAGRGRVRRESAAS